RRSWPPSTASDAESAAAGAGTRAPRGRVRRDRLRHDRLRRDRLRRDRESGYWDREGVRCWVVEMPSTLCWRERVKVRSCWRDSTRAGLGRFPRLNTRLTLSPRLAVTSALSFATASMTTCS